MSTTFNASAFAELDKISTPNFDAAGEWNYQDADDELRPIAKFIAGRTPHNSDVEPDRIKFFYTNKIKKDGGKFIIGALSLRDEMERIVRNDYDYILYVYFPVWKNLDSKNKAIQLDKILCGVNLTPGKDPAEVVVKKKATNIREYEDNLNYFGAEEVLKSSEIVNKAVEQLLEEIAEEKKIKKEQNSKKKKKNQDDE